MILDYQQYSSMILMLWIDELITDAEYNRIMDKLNKMYKGICKMDEVTE